MSFALATLIRSKMLVLEASTASGSVALLSDGTVVARSDVPMGATRDDMLYPALLHLLDAAECAPASLGGIVCGAGPGSFTSLRIAASMAKGLAFAAARPLYAVSSLVLAAATIGKPGHYLVHADALRGERYALAVDIDASLFVTEVGPVQRIPFEQLGGLAGDRRRLAVLASPDEHADDELVTPDAAFLMRCTDWSQRGPVSIDTWEPAYGRLAEAQVKWEHAHGRALAEG